MKAPRPVCAACGEPTNWSKPICDRCASMAGVPPQDYCALCEAGLKVMPTGLHLTKAGGYAGRCMAIHVSGETA